MILKKKILIRSSMEARINNKPKEVKDKAKRAEPLILLRTNTASSILRKRGRESRKISTIIKDQERIKGQKGQPTREETRSDSI